MTKAADMRDAAGPPVHEQVYRSLRDLVMFGALAPGEPVTIQGLAQRTGAGMTPVREALRRLTTEGALVSLGNRRLAVPMLDAAAVHELTDARLALEPRLAARAAVRIGSEAVTRLERTDALLDAAIARGDLEAYLRGNHAFHSALHAAAEAPILTALVEGVWLRFGPSLRVVCGQQGTRSLPDLHKALLAALRAGDPAAAAEAIEGDVRQGMALIAQSLTS